MGRGFDLHHMLFGIEEHSGDLVPAQKTLKRRANALTLRLLSLVLLNVRTYWRRMQVMPHRVTPSAISAAISDRFQTRVPGPSSWPLGKRPDLTPLNHVARETGIIGSTPRLRQPTI